MIESSGDEVDSKAPSKPVMMASKKEMQSPPLREKPLCKPKVSHITFAALFMNCYVL